MSDFDLRAFRKANCINQQELAEYLGIGQGFVSQMERGDRPIPKPLMEKIMANQNWTMAIDTIENNGEMNIVSEDKPQGKKIPLVPFDAVAGPGSFDFQELPVEDYYEIRDFNNADFLIRVKGDSMAPKYNGGDLVACKMVKDMLFFQWGRIYILHTRSQGIMIKRLQPSEKEDCITCVSENPKYAPFEVPKSDIYGVSLVCGSISLE